MSTAGKVLTVLVMLGSLIWIVMMAGVTQINRNGNDAMLALQKKIVTLQEDLDNAKVEIVRVKDQTSLLQEQLDREMAVINAKQNDAQRVVASVHEIASRVDYELATVQDTVKRAEQAKSDRAAEKAAEEQALADARDEVKALQAKDQELRERLTNLRNEFKTTLKSNMDSVVRK
jgi:chromosome segregation ATPase